MLTIYYIVDFLEVETIYSDLSLGHEVTSRFCALMQVVADNYAIRKKSSIEGKPLTSKWRGRITRYSYLIAF